MFEGILVILLVSMYFGHFECFEDIFFGHFRGFEIFGLLVIHMDFGGYYAIIMYVKCKHNN